MYKEVRYMLILDMIRHIKDCVPYPVGGDWKSLEEHLDNMVKDEWLLIDGDCLSITDIGKKSLLSFDYERDFVSSPLKKYNHVLINNETIDARIPMMAFILKTKGLQGEEEVMRSAIFAAVWDDVLNYLIELSYIENSAWQQVVSTDEMFDNISMLADVDAWKQLGKDEKSAFTTGKWLLNPTKWDKNLIQLTRH